MSLIEVIAEYKTYPHHIPFFHTIMPFNENPPRPPEGYNRQLSLALLSYLAFYQQSKKDSDVLLVAPIGAYGAKKGEQNSGGLKETTYLTKDDITILYSRLKSLLLNDLELPDADLRTLLEKKRMRDKKNHASQTWNMLISLVSFPPDDLFVALMRRSEIISDESFIKKFGYTTIVRGLNHEVLALSQTTRDYSPGQKKPLYLGMTVRYRKKLGPPKGKHPLAKSKHQLSPGTGPLEGEGKIIRISIPKIGPVPDQAVTLLVKDGKITTETFLAIDELILE